MNDILSFLVINWDQTAIHLVPVSGWIKKRQREKSIPMPALDDEKEITVVLTVTHAEGYLLPQMLYQSKIEGGHPAIEFPPERDVCHSENHWSK